MAGKLKRSGKGQRSKEFQHSHAFIIGVNDYGNGVPPLRSAANDARKLATLLADRHGQLTHLFTDVIPSRAGINDRVVLCLVARQRGDRRLALAPRHLWEPESNRQGQERLARQVQFMDRVCVGMRRRPGRVGSSVGPTNMVSDIAARPGFDSWPAWRQQEPIEHFNGDFQ
jgi:hypothetical protein